MAVDYSDTLGQAIKRRRTEKGMSLRVLARQVGINHVTVMRIENDEFKMVDPASLKAIADALCLDRQYLLSLMGAGIADPELRIIARAMAKMTPEERRQMMDILRYAFPEAFRNAESDELDQAED